MNEANLNPSIGNPNGNAGNQKLMRRELVKKSDNSHSQCWLSYPISPPLCLANTTLVWAAAYPVRIPPPQIPM